MVRNNENSCKCWESQARTNILKFWKRLLRKNKKIMNDSVNPEKY